MFAFLLSRYSSNFCAERYLMDYINVFKKIIPIKKSKPAAALLHKSCKSPPNTETQNRHTTTKTAAKKKETSNNTQ
jgi:hypothetical protein